VFPLALVNYLDKLYHAFLCLISDLDAAKYR
jgi:hypothetical protein